ncbi:hypothetical protein ABIE67_001465 [Streptomyces sp. V4I8]
MRLGRGVGGRGGKGEDFPWCLRCLRCGRKGGHRAGGQFGQRSPPGGRTGRQLGDGRGGQLQGGGAAGGFPPAVGEAGSRARCPRPAGTVRQSVGRQHRRHGRTQLRTDPVEPLPGDAVERGVAAPVVVVPRPGAGAASGVRRPVGALARAGCRRAGGVEGARVGFGLVVEGADPSADLLATRCLVPGRGGGVGRLGEQGHRGEGCRREGGIAHAREAQSPRTRAAFRRHGRRTPSVLRVPG